MHLPSRLGSTPLNKKFDFDVCPLDFLNDKGKISAFVLQQNAFWSEFPHIFRHDCEPRLSLYCDVCDAINETNQALWIESLQFELRDDARPLHAFKGNYQHQLNV